MRIIPVIDISKGQAVHARLGQRENYKALRSNLCNESDPLIVAQSYLNLYPFDTIYVADLDALTGKDAQQDIISALLLEYPDVEFWLDMGTNFLPEAERPLNAKRVLGTETNMVARDFTTAAKNNDFILSLDFAGNSYMGQTEILEQEKSWPSNVIVMSLGKVGSGSGPDTERLNNIKQRSSSSSIFAAGGVRDIADLRDLRQAGFAGALIASCLHNGSVSEKDLLTFHEV